MEENDGLLLTILIVLLIFGVVTMFGVFKIESGVTLKEVQDEMDKIKVPSAEEIAKLIVVPEAPEFEVPEFKSDSKVLDLWEDLYSEEISELEDNAYDHSLVEFEDQWDNEFYDWLELNIEGFDDFKSGYDFDDAWDEDDCEVEVVELGLEEDDDKSAKVVCELKVKYDLREGEDDSYKKYVFVTSDVSYDEGDYSDEHVKLVYSFE